MEDRTRVLIVYQSCKLRCPTFHDLELDWSVVSFLAFDVGWIQTILSKDSFPTVRLQWYALQVFLRSSTFFFRWICVHGFRFHLPPLLPTPDPQLFQSHQDVPLSTCDASINSDSCQCRLFARRVLLNQVWDSTGLSESNWWVCGSHGWGVEIFSSSFPRYDTKKEKEGIKWDRGDVPPTTESWFNGAKERHEEPWMLGTNDANRIHGP